MNLNLCRTALCPLVLCSSPGDSHNSSELRKLIKSIYHKNNSYLSIDKVYEENKTLALAKLTAFTQLFHLKKIVNLLDHAIKNFIKTK